MHCRPGTTELYGPAILLIFNKGICGSFLLVMLHVGVCCAVVSVPCCLVVTCWERVDLLAVEYVVFFSALSLFQMCPGPLQN